MKGYKDYMDNINVDPSLHEKIMSRATNKTAPKKRIKYVYRFAGIAACVALLMFGIWAIPNLLNDTTPGNGGPNGYIIRDPNGHAQNGNGEATDPPFDMHALIFNEVESFMSASRIPPDGNFDYDLTDEQLGAVFPNLGLTLSVAAHYRSNGDLWFVAASEYEWDGSRRNYTWTTIHLGNEDTLPETTTLFHGDDPIISASDVHGVSVTAFVYGMDDEYFRADFVLGGVAYRVETSDILAVIAGTERSGMERLTSLVNEIILGGPADLSTLEDPIIPELRNDRLTLAEARLDADFGMFLPQHVPSGFTFETALRLVNTRDNSLFVHWSRGLDVISWRVGTPLESDLWNIVSANDREKFDVSLYSIPWFDSVPAEFRYYFQSPVFLADEFTLDVIIARTMLGGSGRSGAAPRPETTQFGVLFGDVLVEVSMTGVSPEEVWEMFQR